VKGLKAAAILTALLAGSAAAEQRHADFTVGARVPVRVTLDALDQPSQLVLNSVDIARGYKDVSARYVVRLNDRSGCLLHIARQPGVVQRIEVRVLGATIALVDEFMEIHVPGDAFVRELPLAFRFVLPPSTQPGTLEFPVQVAATPI
jgi:hypothetical protein